MKKRERGSKSSEISPREFSSRKQGSPKKIREAPSSNMYQEGSSSDLVTTEKEVLEEIEIIGGSESEEQILNPAKPYPRCSRCKRFIKGHEKRRGECVMVILNEQELAEDDKRVNDLRLEEYRRRKEEERFRREAPVNMDRVSNSRPSETTFIPGVSSQSIPIVQPAPSSGVPGVPIPVAHSLPSSMTDMGPGPTAMPTPFGNGSVGLSSYIGNPSIGWNTNYSSSVPVSNIMNTGINPQYPYPGAGPIPPQQQTMNLPNFQNQHMYNPYLQQIQNLQQQIFSMNSMYSQLQTQQGTQNVFSQAGNGKIPPVPESIY